jgi:predicted RNA binding protein YcfA (HicA-like mRNA interferase family)
MNKESLMSIKKVKDFTNAVESMGWMESSNHGGSHRIYRAQGKPTLSIPNGKELSTGVKRDLAKLILGEKYYV